MVASPSALSRSLRNSRRLSRSLEHLDNGYKSSRLREIGLLDQEPLLFRLALVDLHEILAVFVCSLPLRPGRPEGRPLPCARMRMSSIRRAAASFLPLSFPSHRRRAAGSGPLRSRPWNLHRQRDQVSRRFRPRRPAAASPRSSQVEGMPCAARTRRPRAFRQWPSCAVAPRAQGCRFAHDVDRTRRAGGDVLDRLIARHSALAGLDHHRRDYALAEHLERFEPTLAADQIIRAPPGPLWRATVIGRLSPMASILLTISRCWRLLSARELST